MKLSKFQRGEFVAWDGEGIGRGTRHEYVLLASSAGHHAQRARGIGTVTALDLLCQGFRDFPHAIHVGFAISYDVNMLLRDLSRDQLVALWNDETVEWTRRGTTYRATYRPRKFFRITRTRGADRVTGVWWDVWPFFQSSFVAALEKYGVTDAAACEAMRAMKGRRARFRSRDLRAIVLYNRDEVRYLVDLMGKLHASLIAAGLTLSRWDGPGAIAAAMLDRFQFRQRITATAPDAAHDAYAHAYYGGRIECLQYGHTARTIHHYDVNSAYPAAMRSLPCRADGCGQWDRVVMPMVGGQVGVTPHTFAVWRVRWDFRDTPRVLYPFPWRSANGGVYFPPRGEGWVWTPELLAAQASGLLGGTFVLECWRWRSTCQHGQLPCAWINDQYAERQRAKVRGDGAEHALKLGLNSTYGKLAQRVGAVFDPYTGAWRIPPYHDLAGAGWITSTVRAQLYRAATQAPDRVLMLATDGIYSLAPLVLPVSPANEKTLGDWDYQTHPGATIVQSGVYFLGTDDGVPDVYSRGFDADSLDVDRIKAAWHRGEPVYQASHERFIGLGAALSGRARFALWRTWKREPRALALHPWATKRTPVLTRGRDEPDDASRQLIRTTATDTTRLWGDMIARNGRMTTPTAVPWRDGHPGGVANPDASERLRARAMTEDDDSWL